MQGWFNTRKSDSPNTFSNNKKLHNNLDNVRKMLRKPQNKFMLFFWKTHTII